VRRLLATSPAAASRPPPKRDQPDPDVLALQRSAGNAAVTQMIQRYVLDQHAGTKQPGAGEQGKIQSELNPATTPAKPGATGQWDGAGDIYAQMDTHRELSAAVIAHLDKATVEMKAREASPRVPIATLRVSAAGRRRRPTTASGVGPAPPR